MASNSSVRRVLQQRERAWLVADVGHDPGDEPRLVASPLATNGFDDRRFEFVGGEWRHGHRRGLQTGSQLSDGAAGDPKKSARIVSTTRSRSEGSRTAASNPSRNWVRSVSAMGEHLLELVDHEQQLGVRVREASGRSPGRFHASSSRIISTRGPGWRTATRLSADSSSSNGWRPGIIVVMNQSRGPGDTTGSQDREQPGANRRSTCPTPMGRQRPANAPPTPGRSSTSTKRAISRSRPWKSAASDSRNALSALNGLTRSPIERRRLDAMTMIIEAVHADRGIAATSSAIDANRSAGFFAVARATIWSTHDGHARLDRRRRRYRVVRADDRSVPLGSARR